MNHKKKKKQKQKACTIALSVPEMEEGLEEKLMAL